jgi:hypothetical protein
MVKFFHLSLRLIGVLPIVSTIHAQAQYTGYNLTRQGDQNSVVYETADTPGNVTGNITTYKDPDVFLNASAHIGGIFLTVENITAKISLDAQVKKLLNFNAGVVASIDRVALSITDINAFVTLEARLENLVLMIGDVLHSLDLNPILATLGNDLGSIVNNTLGGLRNAPAYERGKGKGLMTRSLKIEKNILYSVNDYSGNTHTNRVLAQNGNILEQGLDNDGHPTGERIVGSYDKDMTFTGKEITKKWDGQDAQELEYEYNPFPGVRIVSAIYKDSDGKVIGVQVISDSGGGGTSTIAQN